MQMRTRVFIARANRSIFTICDYAQALIAVNIVAFCDLDIIQVLVRGSPAVAMVNFQVATGCSNNSASRSSNDPKIGCVHSNIYARIGSKVHRTAHLIIVRAGGRPFGAVVKPVHGNPGFSLRPGQLEHIRRRGRCEQCAGIDWYERDKQSQQNNNLGKIFGFHGYIYSFMEHKRKANDAYYDPKAKMTFFPRRTISPGFRRTELFLTALPLINVSPPKSIK